MVSDRQRCEASGVSIPAGFCHCGCGAETELATRTDSRIGTVKGQPRRFLRGHHNRANKPPEYIVDEKGCWVWQWSLSNGYGQMWGGPNGKRRQLPAHRVYYERLVGPIPPGLQLDHLCRNPACVNPAHLEPVTTAVNVQRGLKGDATRHLIGYIRASPFGSRRLARELGLNRSTVRRIQRRERWVEEPGGIA